MSCFDLATTGYSYAVAMPSENNIGAAFRTLRLRYLLFDIQPDSHDTAPMYVAANSPLIERRIVPIAERSPPCERYGRKA